MLSVGFTVPVMVLHMNDRAKCVVVVDLSGLSDLSAVKCRLRVISEERLSSSSSSSEELYTVSRVL